jgi:hypothetical protein
LNIGGFLETSRRFEIMDVSICYQYALFDDDTELIKYMHHCQSDMWLVALANSKKQTANSKQQTANSKQQIANSKYSK